MTDIALTPAVDLDVTLSGDGGSLQLLADPTTEVFAFPILVGGGFSNGAVIIQQLTASQVWTLNHNLGRFVAVELYTTGGLRVWGDLQNISTNQVRASFDTPMAGYAVIN